MIAVGDPIDWADERWEDFKSDYDEGGFGSSRFSGDLGSSRYDFWRVAVEDQIPEAPLIGAGSDSFAVTYLQNRESERGAPLSAQPADPGRSRGTGIIGALLLLGFVICRDPGRGPNQARRRDLTRARRRGGDPWPRSRTSPCTAAATGCGRSPGSPRPSSPGWRSRADRVPPGSARGAAQGGSGRSTGPGVSPPVVAGAVAVAIGDGIASAALDRRPRRRDRGRRLGRQPGGGIRATRPGPRASTSSAPAPDLVGGGDRGRAGRSERARGSHSPAALEREPQSWYALLELAALDGLDGRWASASRRLEQAASLNPADPLVASAMRGDPSQAAVPAATNRPGTAG